MSFQPSEILRALDDAGVEFVVVGGLAAIAHGASQSTRDFDAVVPLTVENCRRVLSALEPYEPRFYQTIGKPRVERSPEELAEFRNLYLLTKLGIIDLLGSLPPVGSFERVVERAVKLPMFGREYRFVSLDDLIEVKAFVGRPKDKLTEVELRAIRERLRSPVGGSGQP
jgi:predicted nucleotidyltransferase